MLGREKPRVSSRPAVRKPDGIPRPGISAALLGAGSGLGCKVMILLEFGEIGFVWYFLFCRPCWVGCLLAGRRGRRWTAGWRGIFVSGHSYPVYRRWVGLAAAGRWMLL